MNEVRTNEQNALLWAIYAEALKVGVEKFGGWDAEMIHEEMLGEHFGWVTTEALGRKRQTPARRSSRLTKPEFSAFVDFVVKRFAEHGITVAEQNGGSVNDKQYDNTNRGALFKNDKTGGNPNWPDYRGNINVNGAEFWLDAWLKKSKDGKTYMSLSIKPKQPQSEKPETTAAASSDPNDDIPF